MLPTWHLGSEAPGGCSPCPPQLPWQRAEATPGTTLAAEGALGASPELGTGSSSLGVLPGQWLFQGFLQLIFPLISPDYFPATSLMGLCGALRGIGGHKSTRVGGNQRETVPRAPLPNTQGLRNWLQPGQIGTGVGWGGHGVPGVPTVS